MQLEDIAFEEIEPFFNSLGEEAQALGVPLAHLLAADYVCGVRVGGHLAGIGGYLKSYRFIPSSFDVIASRYQGKGLGHELFRKRLDFARKHYSYAVTSIGDLETHRASVHLCRVHGMKPLYPGSFYIAFNLKGRLACRTIKLLYGAYQFVYHLPLGHSLLQTAARYSLKRRSPR